MIQAAIAVEGLTTFATNVKNGCGQILNDSKLVQSLDGRHRLESMQLVYEKRHSGKIH